MKRYHGSSKLAIKPKTTQQVSDILKYCNSKRLAVVPQAGVADVFSHILVVSNLLSALPDAAMLLYPRLRSCRRIHMHQSTVQSYSRQVIAMFDVGVGVLVRLGTLVSAVAACHCLMRWCF